MKLKQTIKRILNEEFNILNEGRYAEPVREITRDVMKEIMSFLNTRKSKIKWSQEYTQETFDEYEENFDVRLKVKKIDSDEPYDIDAAQDWDENLSTDTIELNIEINPKLFTKSLINKFQAELKDTIRHEMEHLSQNNNPNKNVELTDYDNFVDEVLSSRELPAYIQGFYTQAKTRKMYMDDVIDEWANDRIKQFDSIEDKEYVKSELKKFGKKLLPQAKWR
jgi:hypothetical protein